MEVQSSIGRRRNVVHRRCPLATASTEGGMCWMRRPLLRQHTEPGIHDAASSAHHQPVKRLQTPPPQQSDTEARVLGQAKVVGHFASV